QLFDAGRKRLNLPRALAPGGGPRRQQQDDDDDDGEEGGDQRLNLPRRPHLAHRRHFDLPDSLAAEREAAADLVQGLGAIRPDPVTEADDLLLALREGSEGAANLSTEIATDRHVLRRRRIGLE